MWADSTGGDADEPICLEEVLEDIIANWDSGVAAEPVETVAPEGPPLDVPSSDSDSEFEVRIRTFGVWISDSKFKSWIQNSRFQSSNFGPATASKRHHVYV